MFDAPQNAAEATKYRYGQWGGNPRGHAYNPELCAYQVSDGWLYRQCSKKPGSGPAELYCKQHAKRARINPLSL